MIVTKERANKAKDSFEKYLKKRKWYKHRLISLRENIEGFHLVVYVDKQSEAERLPQTYHGIPVEPLFCNLYC